MGNFNFSEIFKTKFLDNFTNTISISSVGITMLMALIFALVVFYVYRLTSDSVIYSKRFNVAMSLMTVITASLILTMQTNIVVSLGMVGALSIVRFRTAIKEPRDLLFLFWAISNGIIIGAGAYSIVLVLSIALTLGLILFDKIPGNKVPMLLVLSVDKFNTEDAVMKILDKNNVKYNVKSRNASSSRIDIVCEVSMENSNEILKELVKQKGVLAVNLLTQDGECSF